MSANRLFRRWVFGSYRSCLSSLGVYRVVFAAAFLILGLPRYLWIARFPDSFFHPPHGPALFFDGFPPAPFFYALNFILVAAALCLLVGYRVRLASVVLPGVLLLGNCWDYAFGQISHESLMLLLIPPLMAAAGWERPLCSKRRVPGSGRLRAWPVALLALLVGLLLFSAAVPKVTSGWLDPGRQGLRYQLALNHYIRGRHTSLSELALGVDWPIAWKAADILTVVLEAGFLGACLSLRTMRVFCALACFFHAAVYFLMSIFFWSMLLAYAAFVDWSALLNRTSFREAAAWWDRLAVRVRWYHVLPVSLGLGAVYVWVGNPFVLALSLVPGGLGAVVSVLAVTVALVYLCRSLIT